MRTLLVLLAASVSVFGFLSTATAQTPLPQPTDLGPETYIPGTTNLPLTNLPSPNPTPFTPVQPQVLDPIAPVVQPIPPGSILSGPLSYPQSFPPSPTASLGGDHLPPVQHRVLPSPVAPAPRLLLPQAVPTIDDFSWILIEKPRPRPIRIHDLITVTVDDKNEVFVDNRFNRSRISQITAELKEFVRLKDGRLENAGANSPTIDATLQSRLNSQGQILASEGIKSIITASVVDIQPNGNLVLEAKKEVRTNRDVWEYRVTGVIRPEKISRDFTALSEDLAELKIEKKQNGKVHHATKRPWGVVLYDLLSPF